MNKCFICSNEIDLSTATFQDGNLVCSLCINKQPEKPTVLNAAEVYYPIDKPDHVVETPVLSYSACGSCGHIKEVKRNSTIDYLKIPTLEVKDAEQQLQQQAIDNLKRYV